MGLGLNAAKGFNAYMNSSWSRAHDHGHHALKTADLALSRWVLQ